MTQNYVLGVIRFSIMYKSQGMNLYSNIFVLSHNFVYSQLYNKMVITCHFCTKTMIHVIYDPSMQHKTCFLHMSMQTSCFRTTLHHHMHSQIPAFTCIFSMYLINQKSISKIFAYMHLSYFIACIYVFNHVMQEKLCVQDMDMLFSDILIMIHMNLHKLSVPSIMYSTRLYVYYF